MQIALIAVERFTYRGMSFRCVVAPFLSSDEDGQDLLEYAMLCALIALVAFGAVQSVGTTINNVFWSAIAASSV